jgi:hypothetical protein
MRSAANESVPLGLVGVRVRVRVRARARARVSGEEECTQKVQDLLFHHCALPIQKHDARNQQHGRDQDDVVVDALVALPFGVHETNGSSSARGRNGRAARL